MPRKQTSRQRRAVDRGVYNQVTGWNGKSFVAPPRAWRWGHFFARQNRTVEKWPWPGDQFRRKVGNLHNV